MSSIRATTEGRAPNGKTSATPEDRRRAAGGERAAAGGRARAGRRIINKKLSRARPGLNLNERRVPAPRPRPPAPLSPIRDVSFNYAAPARALTRL
ncbi:hypothetical protein EVAR_78389_1 [Eumeta japonica]|uniref:Uncharacterized protein n=1 Tax=Eumeta variegata TaxID=151549 RepID=A0A4C1T3G1_EUMVA|nr:hypothetical protein EVAR_78389_1 [Eumeta japonica]